MPRPSLVFSYRKICGCSRSSMGAAKATDTTANHTIICGNWKLWLNRTKILAWHLHCNRHTTHTLHTRHTNFIIITLLLSRTLYTFKFSTYVNYICWKYNLRWAEEMHQITTRRYVILLSLCAIFCIYIHIPWMRLRQKCSPFWRRTHNRNTHIPMALRMQNIYIYILQFDIQIELHWRLSNEIVASLSIHRLDATLPQQNAHHHIFFLAFWNVSVLRKGKFWKPHWGRRSLCVSLLLLHIG